jgi:hypothetical protein
MAARRLLFISCIALVGCEGMGLDTSASYRPEIENYVDCNMSASRKVGKQPGDPVSLGLAARGMCVREDLALLDALRRQHRPDVAIQKMDGYRARTLEANASDIVRTRMSSR